MNTDYLQFHIVCVCVMVYTYIHSVFQFVCELHTNCNSQFQKNINIKLNFYLPIPKMLSQVQNLFIWKEIGVELI